MNAKLALADRTYRCVTTAWSKTETPTRQDILASLAGRIRYRYWTASRSGTGQGPPGNAQGEKRFMPSGRCSRANWEDPALPQARAHDCQGTGQRVAPLPGLAVQSESHDGLRNGPLDLPACSATRRRVPSGELASPGLTAADVAASHLTTRARRRGDPTALGASRRQGSCPPLGSPERGFRPRRAPPSFAHHRWLTLSQVTARPQRAHEKRARAFTSRPSLINQHGPSLLEWPPPLLDVLLAAC